MSLPVMSQYPKELWAKDGSPIRVKFVNGYRDDPNQLGEFCPESNTISVRKGLNKAERFKIFLHECVHAAEEDAGKVIPHKYVDWFEDHVGEFIVRNWDAFGELFR